MLYNREQIKEIIPHRDPFLLIDTIEEIKVGDDGKRIIVGTKNVSADEPYFKGHFPDYPVMPGVLMLEAAAQVGAVMVLQDESMRGKLVFFTGANNVKWRRMVRPGDVLVFEVKEGRMAHGMGNASFVATVEGQLACSAEIMFAIK